MTSANVPSTPPAWTVESQSDTTELAPNGTVVQGVNVGFVTAGGTHSTVFVPNDQYSVDHVRAAITAKAAQVVAVESLSGGVD